MASATIHAFLEFNLLVLRSVIKVNTKILDSVTGYLIGLDVRTIFEFSMNTLLVLDLQYPSL